MDERMERALRILRDGIGQPVTGGERNDNNEDETMTTNYTRLQTGEWGLRSNGAIYSGQRVEVTTRDGRVKTETVGRVLSSRDGVTVATTARAEASAQNANEAVPAPLPVQRAAAAANAPDWVTSQPRVIAPHRLDQIIADLETALAGLKAVRAAEATAA